MPQCNNCHGSGEVMVGERRVGQSMKPRYGKCRKCGGSGDVQPEEDIDEQHRQAQQSGEVFEGARV